MLAMGGWAVCCMFFDSPQEEIGSWMAWNTSVKAVCSLEPFDWPGFKPCSGMMVSQ